MAAQGLRVPDDGVDAMKADWTYRLICAECAEPGIEITRAVAEYCVRGGADNLPGATLCQHCGSQAFFKQVVRWVPAPWWAFWREGEWERRGESVGYEGGEE